MQTIFMNVSRLPLSLNETLRLRHNSFVTLFADLLVRMFIRWFVCSFVGSFNHSFVRSFVCSIVRSSSSPSVCPKVHMSVSFYEKAIEYDGPLSNVKRRGLPTFLTLPPMRRSLSKKVISNLAPVATANFDNSYPVTSPDCG